MTGFQLIVDVILHLDTYLGEIISLYGLITYALLFLIIFIETGLVFTPFLPGDSLLFAAGVFSALGSLNLAFLLVLLVAAAFLGDTTNYWVGNFMGKKILANSRLPVKKQHLEQTNNFFRKYGRKTIVLARFVPVVRTFAPFLAGVGRMNYGSFVSFNIIGGILWVTICLLAGYFFGSIPLIRDNFSIVTISIVVISILPILIQFIRNRRKKIIIQKY